MSTTELAIRPPDNTFGLELVTGDEIRLEATRWLFLAIDNIDRMRKEQCPHLARGGEEMDNVCLRRTHNFLPRCSFTPLEVWGTPMTVELMPDGTRPLKLRDTNPTKESDNLDGRLPIGKPILFVPAYPGETIIDALELTSGIRKGTVEIEVLRDVDYDDGEAQQLESLFFPADWPIPIQLRLVRERIEKVLAAHKSNADVRSAGENMLSSIAQSWDWAQHIIDVCHTQLDQRVSYQHTYSYTPKIRLLMEQLEIAPRQTQGQVVQTEILKALNNSGVSPEVFAQMQERDENLVTKLGEVFSSALAEAFKAVKQPEPKK